MTGAGKPCDGASGGENALGGSSASAASPYCLAARDAAALRGPPTVRMEWRHLLFAHWRVSAATLRPLVPAGLEIDCYDGSAWVGLVPFEMCNTRFRRWSFLPGLSRFYECNVRTYVRCGDYRGVWFLSLDAEHRLPVIGGRLLWNLNYRLARFRVQELSDRTIYGLSRARGDGSTDVEWKATGPERCAALGSIEEFLVERYSLYTLQRGRLRRGLVLHDPWQVRDAHVLQLNDTLLAANGVPGVSTRAPDHTMASRGVSVLGWGLADGCG